MDAFLLARLAAELAEHWSGSWVQGVWQDREDRLVLRLRSPGRTAHLVLSPRPESPGLGLLARRPPCPESPPALAAYVRAHGEGKRLETIRCQPYERAVELWLGRKGQGVGVVLEATGRRGNLLALDAGGGLRAAWRWEGPERSPLRPLTPGATYRAPPAPAGVRLGEVAQGTFDAWVAAGEPLSRRLLGLGPALAAEVLHRHRQGGLTAWDAFETLRADYGRPGPVWEYGDCLSAVELTHRGAPLAVHPWGGALGRAGAWLEEARARAEAEAARRRQTREEGAFRDRLERRLEHIRADLAALPDPRALRGEAEALAAHLHRLAPGAPWADVPDLHEPGTVRRIALDPSLGPGANLDRLYRKARQVEAAGAALRVRLEETRQELARGPAQAVGGRGSARGRRGEEDARGEGPYRRYVSSDGWAIWVGRNGAENDRLLREARPWDLWLHAREAPGAHVLLRKPGREARPPDRTLAEAAGLAAAHSRLREDAGVEVLVAEAGRVRKPKGAGRGRVVVSGERTLRVAPGAGNPRLAPESALGARHR
ncbi:MAG: NFACT RNA binding domain-containing protein [Thermodesulfobacteriota bacterium]